MDDHDCNVYYTGNKLPRRYGEFPLEMAHTPIVDIDPYYADKKTFMVINKEGAIHRFTNVDSDTVFKMKKSGSRQRRHCGSFPPSTQSDGSP